jgi:tetratricopeptide (TPR) repeat protein
MEKAYADLKDRVKTEEDRLLLGQWLNRQKGFDLSLNLIPEGVAKASAPLLFVRLDALAALKNWESILKTLELQPLPMEPYLVELFRARSWGELKKKRESEASWEKTFHLIQYQPNALKFVGGYAIQLGALPQAKRFFQQMARFPNYAAASQVELLHIAEREENYPEMVLILERLIQLQPEMKDAVNDLNYIRLFQDQKTGEVLGTAQALVKENPSLLSYRSTLALTHLKQGNPKEALKTYQGLSIDWKSASPVARWIFYVILKANGEEALAKRFEEHLKGIQLRQVEWDLAAYYQKTEKKNESLRNAGKSEKKP